MVIKPNQKVLQLRKNMRGGDGSVEVGQFLPQGEIPARCRLFAELVLQPGCSIGRHVHTGESEIFYILSGEAEYDDNGRILSLLPGDVSICADGQAHSVANRGGAELRLLACIITA